MAVPSRHHLVVLVLAVAATLGISTPLWAQQPGSPLGPEDAYWQTIRPRIDVMVHTVSQSPQFLSGNVGTPGWAASVAAQNATVQSMVREIATVQPPPHLAQAHGLIVVGAEHCWRAISTFIIAVEQGSQQFMDYGMGYLTTCQSYMADATRNQSSAVPVQPAASVATPMPGIVPTANMDANLHSGPGGNYPVVGSAVSGQSLTLVGRNAAGDWYQLSGGVWIVASLVSNAPPVNSLPVVAGPPLPEPTNTPVQACDPSYPDVCIAPYPPDLNCPDVEPLKNFRVLPPDPHGLDGNSDGIGCEE